MSSINIIFQCCSTLIGTFLDSPTTIHFFLLHEHEKKTLSWWGTYVCCRHFCSHANISNTLHSVILQPWQVILQIVKKKKSGDGIYVEDKVVYTSNERPSYSLAVTKMVEGAAMAS